MKNRAPFLNVGPEAHRTLVLVFYSVLGSNRSVNCGNTDRV